MSNSIIYLNAEDIRALQLSPALARQSVQTTFGDHASGLNQCLPKAALDLGPGHGFQSMAAASKADGIATIKWVSMVPVAAGSNQTGIHATICVNDYATGEPLAIMDGNEITLIRTAAMSAAAAAKMVAGSPKTIGMVGCGLQAYAHLTAFRDLFPSLEKLVAFSRSKASAEGLAEHARQSGLQAEATDIAEDVLRQSDIVISMVPGAPGLKAFLDARLLKPDAFVSAVDIGRSWIPESLSAFELRATDSLTQSKAPYDSLTKPVESAPFHTDLVELCSGKSFDLSGRKLFCFRGYGLADMALASVVLKEARKHGAGLSLAR